MLSMLKKQNTGSFRLYGNILLKPLILFLLLTGGSSIVISCIGTDGTLEIEGKVMDSYTEEPLPGIAVIINGLLHTDDKEMQVYAGQFSTDSTGSFRHRLVKVPGSRYYNFSLAGDSDYFSKTTTLGLFELKDRSKYLRFGLDRLTELTIRIRRESRKPAFDTLSLFWESGGIYSWALSPYRVENNIPGRSPANITEGKELRWIGGFVNSTVITKVFSNKRTKLYWDIDRYGKRSQITDTITCRREFTNVVNFTY